MGSETYHEPFDKLTLESIDLHRALRSFAEELDAVDWYQQRIDATADGELQAILIHNRDEEKEHAAMLLEWIQRRDVGFSRALKTYLFTKGEITQIEKEQEQTQPTELSDDCSPCLSMHNSTATVGSLIPK